MLTFVTSHLTNPCSSSRSLKPSNLPWQSSVPQLSLVSPAGDCGIWPLDVVPAPGPDSSGRTSILYPSLQRRAIGCLAHSTLNFLFYWNIVDLQYYFQVHSNVMQFRSDQSLSRVWLFATPWITARQASLSITNSQSSLRLTSIESVMPSSHLILCRPLLLLPPIPPSIRVFSNESTLRMRWPKYWRFSFSIIPSKEIPGLISHSSFLRFFSHRLSQNIE